MEVIAKGEPAKTRSLCGCVSLCVPISQRRRTLGAAVACYAPREMLDEEVLARLCNRLEMDTEVAARLAARDCRHGVDEANDFLMVLDSMLKREQEAWTAWAEINSLSDLRDVLEHCQDDGDDA